MLCQQQIWSSSLTCSITSVCLQRGHSKLRDFYPFRLLANYISHCIHVHSALRDTHFTHRRGKWVGSVFTSGLWFRLRSESSSSSGGLGCQLTRWPYKASWQRIPGWPAASQQSSLTRRLCTPDTSTQCRPTPLPCFPLLAFVLTATQCCTPAIS